MKKEGVKAWRPPVAEPRHQKAGIGGLPQGRMFGLYFKRFHCMHAVDAGVKVLEAQHLDGTPCYHDLKLMKCPYDEARADNVPCPENFKYTNAPCPHFRRRL